MVEKDGGSAFPGKDANGFTVYGASLRDYFAAAALSLTTFACDEDEGEKCSGIAHAKAAYEIADAMLAERERER